MSPETNNLLSILHDGHLEKEKVYLFKKIFCCHNVYFITFFIIRKATCKTNQTKQRFEFHLLFFDITNQDQVQYFAIITCFQQVFKLSAMFHINMNDM